MAITSNGDKFLYGGASQPSSPARYPWRAGAAQPRRASQGTNYGAPSQGLPETPKAKSSSGDYSVYSPQSFTMPGYQTRQQSDGSEQYTGQNDFGNFGNMPVNHRPLPFSAQYTNFDGTTSSQPNFGQRDAFIQNINDAMMPYYGGKSQGAPQFDFQNMWKSAGDMVQNGWQNPFAMPIQQQPSLEQQLAQYAPKPQYQGLPAEELEYMRRNPYPVDLAYSPPQQYQPDVSRQSIYAPLTPEQEAKSAEARRSYWEEEEAWEKSGKPGYVAQPLTRTWDEVEALTGQNPKDNPIQKGTDWSSPYVQQFYREHTANIEAERKAREAWNAGRVRPGTEQPQATSFPNDPYAQFRPDDSGMLYRPGVNAPASTSPASQKPFDMYWGHGNQAGWEAAGAPKSAPMLSPGLLGWDVNPRNPNAVPYSPPPAPLGPNGFPLYYY